MPALHCPRFRLCRGGLRVSPVRLTACLQDGWVEGGSDGEGGDFVEVPMTRFRVGLEKVLTRIIFNYHDHCHQA